MQMNLFCKPISAGNCKPDCLHNTRRQSTEAANLEDINNKPPSALSGARVCANVSLWFVQGENVSLDRCLRKRLLALHFHLRMPRAVSLYVCHSETDRGIAVLRLPTSSFSALTKVCGTRTTAPLTVTCPSKIRSSAALREATPAAASTCGSKC